MRPVTSGSSIVTVDFDRVTSKIYWADASQKKIWSANQNGTDKVQVKQIGQSECTNALSCNLNVDSI